MKSAEFSLSYFRLLAIIAVSATIASFVTVGISSEIFSEGLDENAKESIDQLNATVVDSCNTYNVQDGIQILDARIGKDKDPPDKLVDEVFTISDCRQTLKKGQVVALEQEQKEQYLQVLRGGRNPVVENGEVVGSETFE